VRPTIPQLRAPTIIRNSATGSSLLSISIAYLLVKARKRKC
jgi:hypothetical protein